MHYLLKDFVENLKNARLKKGLSQQGLGERVGMPQSYISKIESGQVNLQLSSLIELSRALEMELMLVPRQLIPTFQSFIRGVNKETKESVPLYQLDDDNEEQENE